MTRTRARLTVGEVLDGAQCGQLRVQGCLLYKEWDEEDRGFSYWEEWELAGSDRREYWVEVDHDSDAVSLYELLPAADVIDPAWLDADRSVVLIGSLAGRRGRVAERGVGVVEQVLGRTTGSASPGEPMIYATVRLAGRGVPAEVTFENRRGHPLRAYRKRVLSRRDQKRVLGRVIHSGPARFLRSLLLGILVLIIGLTAEASCSGSDSCNPDTGDCSHQRSPYGGGGGGVGK